jgi:predicted signal transduction protein with EAL and GGDEF domain
MNENITDLSGNAIFQLRVRQALLAAQHSVKQVGLLLIAFDTAEEFPKEINTLVPEFLDMMLTRLRSVLRDSDTVVAMESGQAAVLLQSIAGPEDVLVVTNKILQNLEKPLNVNGARINIRPRIGIALFPEHSTNANNLMQRAALALTSAKQTSNRYLLYSEDHAQGQRTPLRMSELRQAIVADEIFLLYQPKVSLNTGSISGVEVLTRWQHPNLGLISPDEFIPVAERTGLIIPLTLWVLHQALLQCRNWNAMGLNLNVAVNLSMWNLEAQELPGQIQGMLKSVGVPPDRLELEITESAIMGDPQRTMRSLTLMRDLGIAFAIDDFGTGYSSLAHLKKLPVASIKIDKSFVQNMEQDRDNAIIVRSITDLGHNLGLKVVAEGVETFESKEMLKGFDCDEGQGYYYSRPVPAYALTKLLASHDEASTSLSKLLIPPLGIDGLSLEGKV